MTDAGWVAACTGFVGALLVVVVGVPLSDWIAARSGRCPVCQGDMETCNCGTHKPGIPHQQSGGAR